MRDDVIDTLAVYRLTRLVTADGITQPLRGRFLKWATEVVTIERSGVEHEGQWSDNRPRMRHPKLAELVECPFCVSVYAATGVLVARKLAPRWWGPLAHMLALSGAAALLQAHEPEG